MMIFVFAFAQIATLCLTVAGSESESPSVGLNTTVVVPTSSTPFNLFPGMSSRPFDSEEEEVYPNPRKDPEVCRRGSVPVWLCNKDSVLDDEAAQKLENLLDSLYKASDVCPCSEIACAYSGLPMVVIVLRTLPFHNTEFLEDKQQYAYNLAESFLNTWNFDTCQDGAVTVVVANDSLAVTVVGKASLNVLPADCREDIQNATGGYFREGLIREGLKELIEQYKLVVSKEHACIREDDNSEHAIKMRVVIPIIIILVGIIVSAIIAGLLLAYRRRGSEDIKTEADVPLRDPQQAEKA